MSNEKKMSFASGTLDVVKTALGVTIGIGIVLGVVVIFLLSKRGKEMLRMLGREMSSAAIPPFERAVNRMVEKQTVKVKTAAMDEIETMRDNLYQRSVDKLAAVSYTHLTLPMTPYV